jgi:hypothetical protein
VEEEMSKKVSSILIGVSGEYFVAAELSRRGYVASITLRNTRGIDIVASNGMAVISQAVFILLKLKAAVLCRPGRWFC